MLTLVQTVKRFLTCSPYGNHIKIWDTKKGSLISEINNSNVIGIVYYSPDGKWIVTPEVSIIKLWNPITGDLVATAKRYNLRDRFGAFTPDSSFLIMFYEDCKRDIFKDDLLITLKRETQNKSIQSVEADIGRQLVTFAESFFLHILALSNNQKLIAINPHQNEVEILSLAERELIDRLPAISESPTPLEAIFSPNNDLLLVTSIATKCLVWDVNQHALLLNLSVTYGPTLFCLDSKFILTLEATVFKPALIDIEEKAIVYVFEGYSALMTSRDPFISNGNLVLTFTRENSAKIWDAKTGELLHTLSGQHTEPISKACFSPDGNFLFTGSKERVTLWNIKTGRKITQEGPLPDDGYTVKFTPDSNAILIQLSSCVNIYSTSTGKLLYTITDDANNAKLFYSMRNMIEMASQQLWSSIIFAKENNTSTEDRINIEDINSLVARIDDNNPIKKLMIYLQHKAVQQCAFLSVLLDLQNKRRIEYPLDFENESDLNMPIYSTLALELHGITCGIASCKSSFEKILENVNKLCQLALDMGESDVDLDTTLKPMIDSLKQDVANCESHIEKLTAYIKRVREDFYNGLHVEFLNKQLKHAEVTRNELSEYIKEFETMSRATSDRESTNLDSAIWNTPRPHFFEMSVAQRVTASPLHQKLLDHSLNGEVDLGSTQRIIKKIRPNELPIFFSAKGTAHFAHMHALGIHIERTGTPLQMAIYGDDEQMVALFKKHMDPAEFERQAIEVFSGVLTNEINQKLVNENAPVEKYFEAMGNQQRADAKNLCADIEAAISCVPVTEFVYSPPNYDASTTSTTVTKAFDRFKNELLRYTEKNSVYNRYILGRLYKISYDINNGSNPSFSERDVYFSQNAITEAQLLMPARWLHHYATGLHNVTNKHDVLHTRRFSCRGGRHDIRSILAQLRANRRCLAEGGMYAIAIENPLNMHMRVAIKNDAFKKMMQHTPNCAPTSQRESRCVVQ